MISAERKPGLKVIEFFSGIGGWAESLYQLYSNTPNDTSCSVVLAIDINDAANLVYSHNFPHTKVLCKTIASLSVQFIDNLHANCWCMSPPCQPFTRNNTSETRDDNDNRTDALFTILSILQQSTCPPTYICLENVVGFEDSNCCYQLLSVLKNMNYSVEEYILTPSQFKVPNERPRYYLTAIRNIDTIIPNPSIISSSSAPMQRSIIQSVSNDYLSHIMTTTKLTIGDYLDDSLLPVDGDGSQNMQQDKDNDELLLCVPQKLLSKSASWCFDICTSSDTTSACFTKSYTRFIRGTGSVLFVPDVNEDNDVKGDDDESKTTTSNNSSNGNGNSISNNNNNGGGDTGDDDVNNVIKNGGSIINGYDTNSANKNFSRFRCTPAQRKYDVEWRKQMNENESNINNNFDSNNNSNNCSDNINTSTFNNDSRTSNDDDNNNNNNQISRLIAGGKLRYFSPTELIRLFGFNHDSSSFSSSSSLDDYNNRFTNNNASSNNINNNSCDSNNNTNNITTSTRYCYTLPPYTSAITRKKCYELIGNSLNVTVTKYILYQLLKKASRSNLNIDDNNDGIINRINNNNKNSNCRR